MTSVTLDQAVRDLHTSGGKRDEAFKSILPNSLNKSVPDSIAIKRIFGRASNADNMYASGTPILQASLTLNTDMFLLTKHITKFLKAYSKLQSPRNRVSRQERQKPKPNLDYSIVLKPSAIPLK